ncbi:MAG: hypothetical protein A07HB70_00305 [uncultured archaeon A07HB70]|nr:MAG: hypothetical protein A07HB70_00305 [uncultured archaeon A07HB70]
MTGDIDDRRRDCDGESCEEVAPDASPKRGCSHLPDGVCTVGPESFERGPDRGSGHDLGTSGVSRRRARSVRVCHCVGVGQPPASTASGGVAAGAAGITGNQPAERTGGSDHDPGLKSLAGGSNWLLYVWVGDRARVDGCTGARRRVTAPLVAGPLSSLFARGCSPGDGHPVVERPRELGRSAAVPTRSATVCAAVSAERRDARRSQKLLLGLTLHS